VNSQRRRRVETASEHICAFLLLTDRSVSFAALVSREEESAPEFFPLLSRHKPEETAFGLKFLFYQM
jgi:hypothetical protein